VAAAARASRRNFGPALLAGQLARLLPQFPRICVCVAFSGGADSTALLGALAALKAPHLRLRAVHVDHQLHAHSKRWSAHCRRVAARLGVPLTVRRVVVARAAGVSPEAAARTARYDALATGLARDEVLLTAHHEDDQLETVLLQLLRGAGVAGLAAMPALAPFAAGQLARPLLGVPRRELRAWAQLARLPWVEDPSNASDDFDRNYLRARVLPLLLERWPAAPATIARGARHAAEAQRLLDELGREDCARAQAGTALSAAVLRRLTPERRRNALRWFIAHAGVRAPPARRLEEIAGAMLSAAPDTHPFVAWDGMRMQRSAGLLRLAPERPGKISARAEPAVVCEWPWPRQRRLRLPRGAGALRLRPDPRGPIDLDALGPRLSVRTRQGGERLRTVAGGVRRSLKGLLQEARVPVEERAGLPLIYRGDTLVAVADLFLDASVRAGAATRRRGRLQYLAP
jgi:tRNA(Ile)-lysidine synthase